MTKKASSKTLKLVPVIEDFEESKALVLELEEKLQEVEQLVEKLSSKCIHVTINIQDQKHSM